MPVFIKATTHLLTYYHHSCNTVHAFLMRLLHRDQRYSTTDSKMG